MADQDGAGTRSRSGRVLARVRSRGAAIVLVVLCAGAAVPLAGLTGTGVAAVALAAVVVAAWPTPTDPMAARPVEAGRVRPIWPDPTMRLTLDALDDPCFLTDAGGVLRYQNGAAADRFGPARPGDPLSFKLRVPELLDAVDRAGRAGESAVVPFAERVPTERVFAASVRPLRLGRRDGRPAVDFVLIRIRDDTEQARIERARADFVANASHELRTPLASLTGFVETLLGPARDDTANRERFLRIMLEQAQRMARLIDDLLSLSRIEMKGHVRPDGTADLADIARHAAAALAPLAAAGGGTIALAGTDGPAAVRGDRDELIQVVSNLVENGLKYGREGGTVAITVAREPGTGGQPGVRIAVADDGPGIAAEHLPRLTERFYRVDAEHSRRQKGTGLGLAIVKHIVNRHRGRLSIASTPGRGTTVSVWLPAAGPGAAERPADVDT